MSIVMVFQFILAFETNEANWTAKSRFLSTLELAMAIQTTFGFILTPTTWTINRRTAGARSCKIQSSTLAIHE